MLRSAYVQFKSMFATEVAKVKKNVRYTAGNWLTMRRRQRQYTLSSKNVHFFTFQITLSKI